MKKITLLSVIAIFAFSFPSAAQIQQGNVLVGSTFSNLSWQLNSPNNFSFNITPEAAWFVQDNIAIGGYLNFGIQTASNSATVYDYGVGALGRYYTGSDVSILRHGRLFAQATAGIGGVDISDGGGNTNGFDFGFGPGFAYFVTPNVGLETLLEYNGVLGFGSQVYQNKLTLNFGLQIYLPGKSTAQKIQGDVK